MSFPGPQVPTGESADIQKECSFGDPGIMRETGPDDGKLNALFYQLALGVRDVPRLVHLVTVQEANGVLDSRRIGVDDEDRASRY